MFIATEELLLVQQRNALGRRRRGNRAQIRVDVGEVGVRENLAGVGRHLAGRMTDVGSERDKNNRSRGEPCSGGATLTLIAMALVAAILDEEALAVIGIGGEGQGPQNQNQRRNEEYLAHVW